MQDEVLARFADLEPLPQDDGPHPVVQIQYPEGFTQVMDIFRRVVLNGEYSERSLELTASAIGCNAANYTAWQFRRRCLQTLSSAEAPAEAERRWRSELAFTTDMCRRNMKNYQVWFHRRACVEHLDGVSAAELDFVAGILEEDAKNYHAWGHRQWVLSRFGTWEGELAFCDGLLEDDVRNNSAWSHRYFVLQNTTDLNSLDVVRTEVAYAQERIMLAPNNVSPWNYIRGLVGPVGFAKFPQVRQLCESLGGIAGADPPPDEHSDISIPVVQALTLLVEVYAAEDDGGGSSAHGGGGSSAHGGGLSSARGLCEKLETLDPIRVLYWRWRGQKLQAPPDATAAAAERS